MGDFVATEIDGVPTFWADSGRQQLHASLVFRVGMADEYLSTSGWLHLVEHLALHDRDSGTLSVNGSVAILTTDFTMQGDAADVTRTLADVCHWLGSPSWDQLATEAKVLRAETEFRGTSAARTALLQRFGARGPGLCGYHEPGLTRVHPDGLYSLIRHFFTRGNAALMLTGPPPAGLRLPLADGPFRPPPPAVGVLPTLPAAYVENAGLAVSGMMSRSDAATLAPQVLQAALRHHLRETEGGAYAPWASYEAVDQHSAVLLGGADVSSQLLPRLMPAVQAILRAIRSGAWPASVMTDAVANIDAMLSDPMNAAALAHRAAYAVMRGAPVRSRDELRADIHAVTPSDVQAELESFCRTLTLGIPGGTQWFDELPMVAMDRGSAAEGRRFRSHNWPTDQRQLVVGDTALSVGEGVLHQTIRYADVAGVLAHPDGRRAVVREDGWILEVEPTLWQRGREAVEALDRGLPQHLVLPMDARDPRAIPRPMTATAKLRDMTSSRILIILAILGVMAATAATIYFFIQYPAQLERVPWLRLITVVAMVSLGLQLGKRWRKPTPTPPEPPKPPFF